MEYDSRFAQATSITYPLCCSSIGCSAIAYPAGIARRGGAAIHYRLKADCRTVNVNTSTQAKADFGDFLVPMGNLLEPDMNARALAALDDFIVDTTGARLGSLYEDIIQE